MRQKKTWKSRGRRSERTASRILLIRFFRSIGSDLASAVITDSGSLVQRVYLLIQVILSNISYLADISLLATVYCLLTVYFLYTSGPHQETAPKSIRILRTAHFLFLAVLIGLWIAIMCVSIWCEVGIVNYDLDVNLILDWYYLSFVYLVLYLCATIELMAWAVVVFLKPRNQEFENKVSIPHPSLLLPQSTEHSLSLWTVASSYSKPPQNAIFFLSLIALPLLIRFSVAMGIAAGALEHDISNTIYFVENIFTTVCTGLAYAGIVVIAREIEKAHGQFSTGPGSQQQNGYYRPDQPSWELGTQGPGHRPKESIPSAQGYAQPYSLPQPRAEMQGSPMSASSPDHILGRPWAGAHAYHQPNEYPPTPQHSGSEGLGGGGRAIEVEGGSTAVEAGGEPIGGREPGGNIPTGAGMPSDGPSPHSHPGPTGIPQLYNR